jgi:hypothetical protein
MSSRRLRLAAVVLAIAGAPRDGSAQLAAAEPAARDSAPLPAAPAPAPSHPFVLVGNAGRARSSHFKTRFALGIVTSILAHEAGHVVAAYAVGGRPSFGFDKGRPTVYSGIDVDREPRKQFIFSSAGLTVQMLLDEAILDIPHHRGGAFERGLLAGGIGTVLFYTTLGRNARVSDVTFMARTSSLSKTEVSLIYGAIAALHVVRIHRDHAYAHFFAAPAEEGGLKVGVVVRPER